MIMEILKTVDATTNGVRTEHGGNGRILLYSQNSHRTLLINILTQMV